MGYLLLVLLYHNFFLPIMVALINIVEKHLFEIMLRNSFSFFLWIYYTIINHFLYNKVKGEKNHVIITIIIIINIKTIIVLIIKNYLVFK